ncbi:MAG: LysM peptidoglycan-binding domain-containing protein [Cyanobacteria bacterium REEB67]|nr:LysM peptidoglycan-binding domain-containing protein [Cyanobacteria bacterium REEB67]
MPPLEFGHNQPIDNSAMHSLGSPAPDCSLAREVQSQVAQMAQPMPGAESMMGMPGVPGAEQAISPLVQMIMRMPGHIGLASSFFEALSNFFLPQTDMLSLFDPANFGLHIDLSGIMPSDHGGLDVDLSLLPHDAPLLDHLGSADLSSAHSLDLASDRLNLSLGGHSHFLSDHGSASISLGSQLNVSGGASFANPRFEGAGGLVSGPSLSENFNANSLASNNRLFSDGGSIASASRSMMAGGPAGAGAASSSALNSAAMPQTNVASSAANANTSVNAGASNIEGNVSAQGSSANNVSYNVFENLTGNKDVLAANNVSDSYHSTVGNLHGNGADVMQKATGNAHTATTSSGTSALNDNPGGMHAKSMTMDGLKVEHMKADAHTQIADHKLDKGLDHKAEAKADHKAEAKADSKIADAKVEHKLTDAKVEHKAEHKIAEHKPENKPEHKAEPKAEATVAHAKPAANLAANHATSQAPNHATNHTAPAKIAQVKAPVDAAVQPNAIAEENVELAQAPTGQDQFGQPLQQDAGATAGAENTAGGDAKVDGQNADAIDKTNGLNKPGTALEKSGTMAGAKVYTIRSGDCLWNIAKDQLGDATKWSDIYKMNGDVLGANPSLIRPGTSIQLPGSGAESTGLGNVAHYTVKPGDNLWDIAKNQMGDATKWGDLYKANQEMIGSNPSLIQPGQELTINTGAVDPASAQLSSTGAAGSGTLAQAPVSAGAGQMQQGGDIGSLAQNAQVGGQFDGQAGGQFEQAGAPAAYQAGDAHYQASQFNQASGPVSMQPAKVLPAQAEPDAIIQPAHAAELSSTGLSPEAADIANLGHDLTSGQKPVVNTSLGNDLLSMLNKRK